MADLIDKSITSEAKNVDIKLKLFGTDSSLIISDDGLGMSGQELIYAMRFGSKSPRERRSEKDLGPLGLGAARR